MVWIVYCKYMQILHVPQIQRGILWCIHAIFQYTWKISHSRGRRTQNRFAHALSAALFTCQVYIRFEKNFLMKKNIEICQDLRLSYALTRTFFCVTKKPWRVSVFSYRPFYSPSKSRSLPPGLPIAQPWLMSRFASIWIWYVSVLEGSEPSDAEPLLFLNSSNDLEIFRYCISRCLMIQILNTVQGTRALQGFDFGTSD